MDHVQLLPSELRVLLEQPIHRLVGPAHQPNGKQYGTRYQDEHTWKCEYPPTLPPPRVVHVDGPGLTEIVLFDLNLDQYHVALVSKVLGGIYPQVGLPIDPAILMGRFSRVRSVPFYLVCIVILVAMIQLPRGILIIGYLGYLTVDVLLSGDGVVPKPVIV